MGLLLNMKMLVTMKSPNHRNKSKMASPSMILANK